MKCAYRDPGQVNWIQRITWQLACADSVRAAWSQIWYYRRLYFQRQTVFFRSAFFVFLYSKEVMREKKKSSIALRLQSHCGSDTCN
jgi:hypothetical protein